MFQREERYEAFVDLHEDVIGDVQSRVPDEGPRAMLLYPAEEPPEKFYPYRLGEGGVGKKQWRDLNLRDAFAESDVGNYDGDSTLTVDYETLLEIDPDVLLIRGQETKTRAEFEETIVAHLEDNQNASRLTAVENGDVYQGGFLDQGPIINLFQTELAAQRIYADEFGDEQLFDRQRVADVVNGDF